MITDNNKQIEELARKICKMSEGHDCNDCTAFRSCVSLKLARRTIEAGYCDKNKLVKEIFEDIVRLLAINFCSCLPSGATEHYDYFEGDLADDIAALRKKYEGEQVDE